MACSLSSHRVTLGWLLALVTCSVWQQACDAGLGPAPAATAQPLLHAAAAKTGELLPVGALFTDFNKTIPLCTATLIGPRLVVTAAHCIVPVPATLTMRLLIGNDLNQIGVSDEVLEISGRHPHPDYTGGTLPADLADYRDIGALVLTQNARTRPLRVIRPAEVASAVKAGTYVIVAGFGQIRLDGPSGVKYIGTTQITRLGSSEFHVDGSPRPQKCHGDSGGPTIADLDPGPELDLRLIGVASRAGQGCVNGSVETRVDSYLEWLQSISPLGCGSGPNPDCPAKTPKAFGEPCEQDDDCNAKLCLITPTQGTCSQRCDGGNPPCPAGTRCSAEGVCSKAELGEPCANSAECSSGQCASAGARRFCTRLCSETAPCPETMRCVTANEKQACVPSELAAGGAPSPADDGCALAATAPSAATSPLYGWGMLLTLFVWHGARALCLRRNRR